MKIDAHLHLRDDVYVGEEGIPENLVKMMDEVGIDKAVLLRLYVPPRKAMEELEKAREKYPQRFIPFFYALPDFREPVLKLMEEAIRERNFKGIKMHAGICRLEEYIVDPVFELAGELEVPILVDPAGDYANTERLAKAFPETRMIVAHLGFYLCSDGSLIDRFISLAREYPNVFLDISGVLLVDKIEKAIEEVGCDKIIWGTDGPSNQPDPVSFTKREMEKVLRLHLKEEEEMAILGGNIARLLRI
ncbi:MAG: amidohydrolase family protein [bacterium]